MSPHPLTKFEIQKCYQNLTVFFSRNNLPEIKDGAYVIILKKNLDECKSFETHWMAFSVNGDDVTYFDSFVVEHIPKRNYKTNIK